MDMAAVMDAAIADRRARAAMPDPDAPGSDVADLAARQFDIARGLAFQGIAADMRKRTLIKGDRVRFANRHRPADFAGGLRGCACALSSDGATSRVHIRTARPIMTHTLKLFAISQGHLLPHPLRL